MLYLKPTNTGLSFNEWQDAIHDVPDCTVIKSPFEDNLSITDTEYLRLELWYRKYAYVGLEGFEYCGTAGWLPEKTELPYPLKGKRGTGDWQNPEVIIIIEKIESHLRTDNVPLWNDIPRYRRLRPCSGNKLDRAKLIGLLQCRSDRFSRQDEKSIIKAYVTSWQKPFWSLCSPEVAFRDEMDYFPKETKVLFIGSTGAMKEIWDSIKQDKLYHVTGSDWDRAKRRLRSLT